jgi:hypothetical protein
VRGEERFRLGVQIEKKDKVEGEAEGVAEGELKGIGREFR